MKITCGDANRFVEELIDRHPPSTRREVRATRGRLAPMTDGARKLGHVSPEVWAAYHAAPENIVAEIVDGTLHSLPRPRLIHARGASRLGRLLGPFDDDPSSGAPGGWVILDEPELHLGTMPDVLVPDLAGWRRARMPELPIEAACTLAPDWACELLSPDTEAHDRGRKMRVYRREGVTHVWLVNPEARTLEAYRLEGQRDLLLDTYEDDARVRVEPFEAIEIDLAALWAR